MTAANESAVIGADANETPVTRRSLLEDLRRLGVTKGMTLLVHSG